MRIAEFVSSRQNNFNALRLIVKCFDIQILRHALTIEVVHVIDA